MAAEPPLCAQEGLAPAVPGAEAPPASPHTVQNTNNLAAPKRAEPHPSQLSHQLDPEGVPRRGNGCSPIPAAALQPRWAPALASAGSDPVATGDWWQPPAAPARPSLAPGSSQKLSSTWWLSANRPRGQTRSHPPVPLPGDAAGRRPAEVGGEQIVRKKARQSPSSSSEQDLLQVYTPLEPAGRVCPRHSSCGSSNTGARARRDAGLVSRQRVPPALLGPGWGTGAASPMAKRSKSCQEEGDALLGIGLPAASPCPQSPCLCLCSEGHPGRAGTEPGMTARGGRKPGIQADASWVAPAAGTSRGTGSAA